MPLNILREAFTDDQIRHLVEQGILFPIRRGYYRWKGTADSWELRLAAAVDAAGADAAGEFRSAARLLGFDNVPAVRLELVIPRARRVRLNGVVVHQSTDLPAEHITQVRGIRVTTPARTVCDLSAVLSLERLERVVDAPATRRLVTPHELLACRDDLRARGRRRTTVIDELLKGRIVGFDPRDEDLDDRVYRWLVGAGLKPVRQLWVVANGNRYCLDQALPAYQVVFETDGWDSHGNGNRVAFEHDRGRDADLQLAGWLILRFTSRMPKSVVVERALAAVRLRTAAG